MWRVRTFSVVLGCLYMRWLTRLRPDGSDPDSVDRVALHQLFRVWAALASDGAVTSPVLVGQGDQLARDPIVVTEQRARGGLGWASRSTRTSSSPRAARSTQAAWLKRRRSSSADTRTTLISGATDERHGAAPRAVEPLGRLPRGPDVPCRSGGMARPAYGSGHGARPLAARSPASGRGARPGRIHRRAPLRGRASGAARLPGSELHARTHHRRWARSADAGCRYDQQRDQ